MKTLLCKSLLITTIFFSFSIEQLHAATISECITVFAMYLKNPGQVGEIAPISKAAGSQLAKFVGQESVEGKRYLEAGGGCGAISICIAEKLQPNDWLDVVEINPEMCIILRDRLKGFKNVSVHCCSILDWSPGYQYDAAISTLPFLSLGLDFTKQAVNYFNKVLKVGATLSCVEYPACAVINGVMQKIFSVSEISVQQYMQDIRSKHLKESITIYYNIPPINVYHLEL